MSSPRCRRRRPFHRQSRRQSRRVVVLIYELFYVIT